MTDLNMVALIGRLTRDAELKYTPSGIAACKFALAVNRKKKNGDTWVDEASFFEVVLWGHQGEVLNQYLVKGKQVCVNGELRQERWQDRDSGKGRSRIEIIAENIQLLGGGNNGGDNGQGYSGGKSNYGDGQKKSLRRTENDHGEFTDDISF
jgi:single-strand DNA-binding protein